MTILVVGGGHAAGQAVASLRRERYEGRVVMLAEEPHIPYQRPPLSKEYLVGSQGLERVCLRPEAFYQRHEIELRLGVRAERLDIAGKRVMCANGEQHAYHKLLLATGARARRLEVAGADLPGVHYLRTIADADAVKEGLRAARRLVVVGGGYVGLEVAAAAIGLGLDVTVLEREDRVLKRVATAELAAFYTKLHSRMGVAVRANARLAAFAGTARLAAVVLADGEELAADMAVVGVGATPNVSLAAQAGLPCDDGIVVDQYARTEAPDVYAAGDCTNHPNPLLGRRVRLESVPNALAQARVAAANLASANGPIKTYAEVPWFWSDQYDLKLQMVGFAANGERSVTRGDPGANRFIAFHLRGDELVAADAVNSPREFMAARLLVGQRVDAKRLADPAEDIRAAARPPVSSGEPASVEARA